MEKIIKITREKSQFYLFWLSSGEKLRVSEDTLVRYRLLKDQEISPEQIEEIKNAYGKIDNYLDISIENEIEKLYIKTKEQIETYKPVLKGKLFASGYMTLDPFIHSAFLSSLGMKPVYIEADYFFDKNKLWSDKILSLDCNPYVGHTFNFSTINRALSSFPIDYFFGYTPIEKNGTSSMQCIRYKSGDFELGFEQSLSLLKNICSVDKSYKYETNREVNE